MSVKLSKTRSTLRKKTLVIMARLGVILALALSTCVLAQQAVDIPAQSLSSALKSLGQQTGLQIIYNAELIAGQQSPAVQGMLEAEEALGQLLKGSDIMFKVSGNSVVLTVPNGDVMVMSPVKVGESIIQSTDVPESYSGGQVAQGSSMGLLGNRDIMVTPFSVTSYTADIIKNQQARTLADVMANDPSVRDFYARSFAQDAFYIRGFQADSGDFAMNGLYGVSPLLRTSPQALERVEVLKGPSALLNGTPPFGGVGGTVNLIPKRATENSVTELTEYFASDAQFGTHLDIGRRLGSTQQWGFRFNGDYRGGESTLEDNEQQLAEAIIALDYRTESFRVFLDLGYQEQEEDGIENGQFGATGIPSTPKATKRIFQPWLNLESDDIFGSIRAEWDIGENMMVYTAIGGRKNQLEELYAYGYPLSQNGDFTENVAYHLGYNETATWLVGARRNFETGVVVHKLDATLSSLTQERGNRYDFGFAPINSNIFSPNFVTRPTIPILPGSIPKGSEIVMKSATLTDTVSLTESLEVIIGARLQNIQQTDYDTLTGQITTFLDDEKLSPAAGVVYRPTAQIAVYANYIEGFSPAPSYASNDSELIEPAVTEQVEVGVKADYQYIGVTFSLFDIRQPNAIFDPESGRWTQDGEQRNRGAEINLFGEPSEGLRLLGGAMWLDGKLEKTDGGVDDGNTALSAPKLSINMGVEWDAPFPGLTLTARGIYTDEQYVDTANTMTVPSWTRFDLGARYAFQINGYPTTVYFSVENVADGFYWVNSSLYRSAARTGLLSVAVNF